LIDLHCHILPGLDDGAPNLAVALDMARNAVADGVTTVACTPHILPGLYHNTGPDIRSAVAQLTVALADAGIPLSLVTGADNHVIPNFVDELHHGHLLTLADTRYVLVEPPHHLMPTAMELLFYAIQSAGFIPILTHPERLSWIDGKYDVIQRLAGNGVWMQLTAGSLVGAFGRGPKYWSDRMLEEGLAHIIASDAHDLKRRPTLMSAARASAERRLGANEAQHLVETRPQGVLLDSAPAWLPSPPGAHAEKHSGIHHDAQVSRHSHRVSFADRLRRIFAR
jgi:protein-tyrosine phosphatase